ncbi:diaminopropionate ammonia-lyase [Altererythrobacter fulvus]|uniref:diaminopropionate ammonia-lyase n=1 Tax=Caenibius fulvus TaxID=2126012 RepID=UPI0030197705
MAAIFSKAIEPTPTAEGRPGPLDLCVPRAMRLRAQADIPQWEGYQPTPLIDLPGMAGALGLGRVLTKYEAGRFGLGSFKALGGAFAAAQALEGLAPDAIAAATVVTASDGNHGLSVAWGARRIGCACKIYLHENVAESRAELIRAQGAEVVRIAGNYDDSTHQAREDALANGWVLVSDTAITEEDQAPGVVMAGYTVMMDEIVADLAANNVVPTHVFIQGGCGGLAAAAFGALFDAWGPGPRFVMVEPDKADCLYQSAIAGHPVRIEGDLDTVMGGLSVGEVSLTAWKTIELIVGDYLVIPDSAAVETMKALGEGAFGDTPLLVGDAGSAGLAGLIVAARDDDFRAKLGLGSQSIVLTIVTEGAVDAAGYRELTGLDPASVAEARA